MRGFLVDGLERVVFRAEAALLSGVHTEQLLLLVEIGVVVSPFEWEQYRQLQSALCQCPSSVHEQDLKGDPSP